MKKIITGIAALLIAAAAIPVSAAGTTVKNGTPVIDGKMDDIYKQSASVEIENFGFYITGKTDEDVTANKGTTVYYLWDEDYLYICAEVVDNTVTAKEESGVDYKKYETNDNLELYYWGADGVESNRGNIHINCLGLGLRLELMYKELGDVIKAAGTVTDTGYITELAVPVTNFELKAGSAFKFSLQYNNYIPADKASIASGYQKTDGAVDLVPSSEKAVAKKDVNVDSSAKTLDAGIVSAAAALAASGAAFVSLKKKKR